MDRETAYLLIYDEFGRYLGTVEKEFVQNDLPSFLTLASALTDAVVYEKLTLSEARFLMREHIKKIRGKLYDTPGSTQSLPEPAEGSIKF